MSLTLPNGEVCQMSTQNRIRRKVKDYIALVTEVIELVETGGCVLSEEYTFDVIKNDDGSLSFLDSKSAEPQQRICHAGQEFVLPGLTPSVQEGMTFPSNASITARRWIYSAKYLFYLGISVFPRMLHKCAHILFSLVGFQSLFGGSLFDTHRRRGGSPCCSGTTKVSRPPCVSARGG